ncbi:MAG TPA: dihydropteroate synthase [Thermotogota bacterium]|nr:dihydropteroate synthase [Thermotogota bacterium]HRW33736.1 dihydropteroate synthase [Thermotogota bacterium]
MEMCILDSSGITEPGSFVFGDSFLTLKITGHKAELNKIRLVIRDLLEVRFMGNRLIVFGSVIDFRQLLRTAQNKLEANFFNDLKALINLNNTYIHFPHAGKLSLSRPLIMGVINVTDDSFYPQSRVSDEQLFEIRVRKMLEDGVDLIDIGGESSRPGSAPVDEQLEIERIIPFIKRLRRITDIPISVDTYRYQTAKQAINAGADMINDISALRFDKELASFVALNQIPIVLMHMKGTPATMQQQVKYVNVVSEVHAFFKERIAFAQEKGISQKNVILDPGIGFGKRVVDNLRILKDLDSFHSFRLPLLLGTSRKSFIGEVLNQKDPNERLSGTMATTALGVLKGAHIFRVHDVKENREVADLVFNIQES